METRYLIYFLLAILAYSFATLLAYFQAQDRKADENIWSPPRAALIENQHVKPSYNVNAHDHEKDNGNSRDEEDATISYPML